MTHHFVMTSSLRIKILKIDEFGDFSCDIDYNSSTDIFRDVLSLIINQYYPSQRAPLADTKCPHAAPRRASEARLFVIKIEQIIIFPGLQKS